MNDFDLSKITCNEPPFETDMVPRADYEVMESNAVQQLERANALHAERDALAAKLAASDVRLHEVAVACASAEVDRDNALADVRTLEAGLEIIRFELSPGPDAARNLAPRVRVAMRTVDRLLKPTASEPGDR